MSQLKIIILSALPCTIWFIGFGVFLPNWGTNVDTNPDYYIFLENPDKTGKTFLNKDTIYINNNFSITSPGKDQFDPQKFYYNKNSKILLWYFLIISLSSVSWAFIWPLVIKIKNSIKEMRDSRIAVVITIASVIFSISLFLFDSGNKYLSNPVDIMKDFCFILKYPVATIYTLMIPPLIVGILCISGLLIFGYNIYQLTMNGEINNQTISDFRRIRNDINYFLLIIGIVVASGSVITTAALRNAINGMFIGNKHLEFISSEMVYSYSLLYSLFITVVYVPVYFMMVNAGKMITEKINPFNQEQILDWREKRSVLEEYLGLTSSLKENLSAGLVVISPIISGLLSQLISK